MRLYLILLGFGFLLVSVAVYSEQKHRIVPFSTPELALERALFEFEEHKSQWFFPIEIDSLSSPYLVNYKCSKSGMWAFHFRDTVGDWDCELILSVTGDGRVGISPSTGQVKKDTSN